MTFYMYLKALLVDDEQNNLDSLQFMLQNDCTGVEVVAKALNATQARELLQKHLPDVVFLDINMRGENGFQLLNSLPLQNFKVVFVTAHNEYGIQAIKASAVDYILKPVSITELQKAVEKIKLLTTSSVAAEQSKQLLQQLLQAGVPQKIKKIALPQLGGVTFIEIDNIISLQADSNYTIVHLRNMQKIVVSKTLKDFEELLDTAQFVRIHKSYIVNIACVKEYTASDGGMIKMTDGNEWSISRRQLDIFSERMQHASLMFGKIK